MKIHHGTTGDDERPVCWVEPNRKMQLTLTDLIDGLCSKYIRNRTDGDEPLPGSMTQKQLTGTVFDEITQVGFSTAWTWREQTVQDEAEAEAWARGLVLAVLPGLEVKED